MFGGWGGGKKKGDGNEISEAPDGGWNFDPTGFERAAKALKDIDASPNSSAALDLIKQQNDTSKLEHTRGIEEARAMQMRADAERIAVAEEERRKTMEADAYHKKELAQYNDSLARKRAEEKRAAEAYMSEQERKKSEESQLRIEAAKRATLAQELDTRAKAAKDRALAEAEGRIVQERRNHDLKLKELREEGAMKRETMLESIKLVGKTIGEGVSSYFSDQDKMLKTVGTLTAIAVGVYTAKVGTGIAGRFIESRLGKPVLVRDTSKRTLLDAIREPVKSTKKLVGTLFGKSDGNALKGVVLEPKLASRLETVARATFNTKQNGAPYRHLLMYGHPGTGKTMFAKNLARSSGMDYAILTGGDIAPLGRDAVPEMHKIFDWAETSSKGVLLFVDEADAFLRKRGGEDATEMSEDLRNALNAFLYRTGEASKNFMVVFASNQPEQLDWAVQDRVDEMVEFELPGVEQRRQMLEMYFNKYIRDPEGAEGAESSGMKMPWTKSARKIGTHGIGDDVAIAAKLDEFAEQTEGFSGRAIEKMAIAWQASAYGGESGDLDEAAFQDVVDIYADQHLHKQQWR
jgi:ATPase family AAA domain-containing protein 3A/B